MELQEARADSARKINPQEGNEFIAPVGAWYNNITDLSDPCVLYSSSTRRILITHRVAYCCRILLVAPIISEIIQAIVFHVVLCLWSIPTIITTMMVDEMLELEYDFASEVLPGLRALHEWLLIWAEDERVHDSLGKIVVGVYWVVVVLMLYQPISVEPLSPSEPKPSEPTPSQPTQSTLETTQRILETAQRILETTSSSPPVHTNDDEPDTPYGGRVLGKHDDAKLPAMDDYLSNKPPTPAPGPTPEMILKAPSITGAGRALLTPDARNRALNTNFSSMRYKTNPPQDQEDRDILKKEMQRQKQREKRSQKKNEKEREEKEREEKEREEKERVEQGPAEQEWAEQERAEQEKKEQKK